MIETMVEARSGRIHLPSLTLTTCAWEGHLESQVQRGRGHLSCFAAPSGYAEDACGSSSPGSLAALAVAGSKYSWASLSLRGRGRRELTQSVSLALWTPAEKPSQIVLFCDRNYYLWVSLSACGSEGSLGHLSFLSFLEMLQNKKKKKKKIDCCCCLQSSLKKNCLPSNLFPWVWLPGRLSNLVVPIFGSLFSVRSHKAS